MKNKLKTLILAVCFLIPAMMFAGCKNDTGTDGNQTGGSVEPINPANTVTVSFESRYGELSFNEKTYDLVDNKVYLNIEEFPTVSGEGDERIFDKWAYSNGVTFSTDIPVTEDMTLYMTFVDAEFVWIEKWDTYDDAYSLYYNTIMNSNLSSSYQSSSSDNFDPSIYPAEYVLEGKGSPKFKKIKKTDCLDEYITKSEFNQNINPYRYCFVTSSNKEEKAVKESDITTDTYKYYVTILIGNQNFGYNSIGYLPKGVSMYDTNLLSKQYLGIGYIKKGWCLGNTYRKFVDEYSVEYPMSGGIKFSSGYCKTSNQFVVLNGTDKMSSSLEKIREMCEQDSYSCSYDFNESVYFAYFVCDYFFCYDYSEQLDEEHFSFIAKDWNDTENVSTIIKKGCTKEEFDAFKNQYNLYIQ